ncbi:MAG TPA: aminotransferase class V-fold PLP-dependent enzyme [Longimicrobiales bacterium]|nr:aminotransferase class V-fold PLP-dependent enzyme [Longimicrobiales bacterium]
MRKVTYLDFAATSAVRPPAVAAAVSHYLADVGASAGRGGHRLANEAGRMALHCRQRLAALLGVPGDAGRIAFAANATHALNTGIWGTVGRGERVVVTALEHNSVLRPAARVARERDADVVMVAADIDGSLDMRGLERALDGARLFCLTAASNVLGTRTDVAALAAMARAAGVLTLVDAAQAAGHLPVDAAAVDMLAFTGHKGLLGPPGIGGLWVRDGLDVDPIITGGTGGNSLERDMPAALPDRLEAGTLNGAGIAGLLAGADHVLAEGVASLHARLSDLKLRLHHGLSGVRGLRVLSPPAPDGVPIVTVTSDVVDAATFAARLDREHSILTRAGLHCAPEVHRLLGTERTGAVRFSLGWCSSAHDVDRAVDAVSVIAAGRGARA